MAQSITQLGKNADQVALAKSLTVLGEIYQCHQQYDLAITNYKDALEAHKTSKTTLLLAEAYNLNSQYTEAEDLLTPLLKVRTLIPYQKVSLYECLGDAYLGQGQVEKAVSFYQEGVKLAQMNQITPKLADLNSKIADAYASDNKLIEADAFYDNSLQLSKKLAPERALQEKEKVADYYNQKNEYGAEIQLRKESLGELNQLPRSKVAKRRGLPKADSITPQRINYKIANAYIALDKYDEAIPYLKESIERADTEDDLVVQKDATRKLSEVLEFKGEYTKALETYRNYVALVDTLYIRKEQEISRAARFNREISAKQSRISGLEQERELSQSKYDLARTESQLIEESNKRQKWVIYSLLGGIVLLGSPPSFFTEAISSKNWPTTFWR